MELLEIAKNKILNKTLEKCGDCPAHWQSCDYMGEWDSGCSLHKDIDSFCPIALLPKTVSKIYVKRER